LSHHSFSRSDHSLPGGLGDVTKPFRNQEMLDAVNRALAADQKRQADEKMLSNLRLLYETLTPREREVLAHITTGRANKVIAADLDVSEITVKVHRSNVMRKMEARSLANLARIVDTLGIRRSGPTHT
jgi:FixJ family two-component response regulator